MDTLSSLSKLLILFNDAFEDDYIKQKYLKIMASLITSKQNIMPSAIFDQFYSEIYQEINFPKIVTLFEKFYKDKIVRKNRNVYLIAHWLYYQICLAKSSLISEDIINLLHECVEKKMPIELMISSEISSKVKLDQNQIKKIKEQIQKSQIFGQIQSFFTVSQQISQQKILEKHQQLIDVIKTMRYPGVIEYELQKHILVQFEKKYKRSSQQGDEATKQLIPIKQLIDLLTKSNRMNQKLKKLFDELKYATEDKNKYNILEGIKKEITILDVYLLKRLIKLSQNVSEENGKKSYKNIALFVGPSGSGKTTAILSLLGYKLVETEIQGLQTLQPQNLRPQHFALRTSPESTSTTRYMFAAKFPKESFPPGLQMDLYACDSPGFQDTAGVEVDISNSISILETLRKCASVKLVVVISQRKIGEKFDGIRQIARIISNIVKSYKSIEDNVTIIFNKFECQKEYDRIQPGINSILSNLLPEQKSQPEYVNFLRSLLKRIGKQKVFRFSPSNQELKKQVMEELVDNPSTNPGQIFKYSLSTKSTHIINSRKTILLRLIKDHLGKNNQISYYYLKELQLLCKCLRENNEIQQEIANIKKTIQKQVEDKFKTFERRLQSEVIENNSNKNTYMEINKITQQIKQFDIFKNQIKNLVTSEKIHSKIEETKKYMIQNIENLQFSQNKIEEVKLKIINTIHFFNKFQCEKMMDVFHRLIAKYQLKDQQFTQLLAEKKFVEMRDSTKILRNIFEVIKKADEEIRKTQINPEKLPIMDKQQLNKIKTKITKSFQQLVQQSTKFLFQDQSLRDMKIIKEQNIAALSDYICMLENLEEGGPFLDQIFPRTYKNLIIRAVADYTNRIIEESNNILDPSKAIDDVKVEKIRTYKLNTLKLKQIKGVYGLIGEKIVQLWNEFQKFISGQNQRLVQFLDGLKTNKEINRKTLKNFKVMIDRIIKFSEGDEILVSSINKLKTQIRKSLVQHIRILKAKSDKFKVTIKLKRSLEEDQMSKVIDKFKEIQAFYKIKQFNNKGYFAVSNDAEASKLIQEVEESDNDQIEIAEVIEEMYQSVIQKLLKPFQQINDESKKLKTKTISSFPLNFLQLLDYFLLYKNNLEEMEISNNKDFSARRNELISKEDSYIQNVKTFLGTISSQFEEIYNKAIVNADPQKQLYRLEISKIKQFKKFANFVLRIKQHSYLQELFIDQKFECNEYLERIIEILKKSQEYINSEVSNRKQNQIQYTNKILYLKQQLQEMKLFDDLQFNKDRQQDLQFTKLYDYISNQIRTIEGKHSNAINNLFKDDTIIIQDVKQMYTHLSMDALKNQEKLTMIYTHLKEYGNNLKKSISPAKEDFKNEESLESQPAIIYFNRLQKAFKFYQGIGFVDCKFMEVFSLNEAYFANEIIQLQFEEKIRVTYSVLKGKLCAYEYKSRPREFDKVINVLKKIQYIVSKVTNDNIYQKLYAEVEAKEQMQIEEEQNKMTKFSQRLRYFYNKYNNSFNSMFVDQGKVQEAKNKTDFLYDPNFLSMYNKVAEEERKFIDDKIEEVMQEKLVSLKSSYDKPEEVKKNIEEQARKILDRLPIKEKKKYRQKFEGIQEELNQKIDTQVIKMKRQLNQNSGTNIFSSVIKFEQYKNPTLEKQCKNILEKQLNALGKDLIVMGQNKRTKMVDSFKKYLKFFGHQNNQMLSKVRNNQKLSQLFNNQQKQFYVNFIFEEKEVIREIQGEMIRCSKEGLSVYERKCQQINQLYMLVIQEDYQGLCMAQNEQILRLWENFIMKINDKIKDQYSNCPQNILNHHPSSIQIFKKIIEFKILRIFIDSLLKNTNRIANISQKRYAFIQQIHKEWQSITTDQTFLSRLTAQIDTLIRDLKQRQFFNDLIKFLNASSLEIQFENNMSIPLKTIRQYEQIYNNYLVQRQSDKISSQALVQMIQAKWLENINLSFEEFQSSIAHQQEEISQRMLILYNLSQIITKKKWDFIDKTLKAKDYVEQFLEDTFSKLKKTFNEHLDMIDTIKNQKESINKEYTKIKQDAEKIFEKMNDNAQEKKEKLEHEIQNTVDQEAKQRLQLQYQNIESLKNQAIQTIKTENYNEYQGKKAINEQRLKNYIKSNVIKELISMKKFIHSVNWKSRDNGYAFNECMEELNKKSKEINQIIYKQLQSSNNNYALIIAAESDIFKAQAAIQFKNKTAKQDINYIINKCPQVNHDNVIKDQVLKFYHLYEQQYNRIIQAFKKNPHAEQINIVAKQLRDQKDRNDNRKLSDNIPTPVTIARIFAIWSMTKTDISKSQISIDFQPHPAQIVAIFLLTGFNQAKLTNQLVEVLTGEGKSIVLAGLCCYLALKGYYPYCACYSEYLSSRDQKQFKDLFQLLQISQRIKYGTFNMHCEEIINETSSKFQKGKTFREHMRSIIMNKADRATFDYFSRIFDPELHKRSKKVLIIDEADVFFNQNFFGRLYCPSLSLDDEEIKDLIELVWKKTKESRQNDSIVKITKQEVYETNEFKRAEEKYPAISNLIKNQVIGMLQAVYNYKHGYIIHQDSIKYRDNDSITDKISYGYKTVFAHCYEYERKAISQLAYQSALKITLNIAPFSYSELPTFFQSILGVSGTVNSMSDYKKQMLSEKYRIQDTYEIPSIYGDSQRTKDHFSVVKDEQLYDQVVARAKIASESKRPIAIFFKTIKDVTNFYKSPQFKQFTKNTTILSEQTDHDLRDTIIKRVGQHEKITIMTESFSRGTDFKIFDKRIDEIGGLHVIQTFISQDLSEYIQARGRTARQGNKGSFQILVNETQLQKFEITCEDMSKFEDCMKEAWRKKNQIQCQQLRIRVENSKAKHEETQKLFKNRPTKDSIIEFIFNHNKFAQIKKNHVRTLIGIDGTVSMGMALQKVFNILEDSFIRTKLVLENKKVLGSFENEIAIYRNYNTDHEQLLEYSGFQTDSEKLKNFLSKVKINGGWINEAMEVLFQHANNINKLDQIILIADARSNDFNETQLKRRKMFGEDYWVNNGFPLANETQQVLKLKNKKVKIHTLYIYLDSNPRDKKQQLKQYCNKISEITEGISSEFKVKNESASDFLTAFLVKNILNLIGGQQKGKELMESYDKDFGNIPLRL